MSFTWQHIQFEDGSNPYICKTEQEFKKMQRTYNLVQIKPGFWFVRTKQENLILKGGI